MDFLRLMGLCILASAMAMVVRQMHPQSAALLTISFGAMVLLVIVPMVRTYIDEVLALLDGLRLQGSYGRVMLKAMGISLVTQLCAEACREMDAAAVAGRAELCGRLALLGVCMPVFLELTRMAVGVLR